MEIIMESIAFVYWDRNGNMLKSYFDCNYLSTYNPETHELVEKKEAKIKRLKSKVTELQRLFDFESKIIDKRISSLAERKEELDKLKKELEAEENS